MSPAKEVSSPVVSSVAPAGIERAISVLALAFSADPMARWAYPDPDQYFASFQALVRAFGGRAFELDTGALCR